MNRRASNRIRGLKRPCYAEPEIDEENLSVAEESPRVKMENDQLQEKIKRKGRESKKRNSSNGNGAKTNRKSPKKSSSSFPKGANVKAEPKSPGSAAKSKAKKAGAVKCVTNTNGMRPTPAECFLVVQALSKIHPDVVAKNNERRMVFALRDQRRENCQQLRSLEATPDLALSSQINLEESAASLDEVKPEVVSSSAANPESTANQEIKLEEQKMPTAIEPDKVVSALVKCETSESSTKIKPEPEFVSSMDIKYESAMPLTAATERDGDKTSSSPGMRAPEEATTLEQLFEKQSDTPVTDAIISTMLSQNTTDANQHRAFAGLKKAFPGGWEEVAGSSTNDDETELHLSRIEAAIRVAGLAKIRAKRIHSMLTTIREERGAANFEYLLRPPFLNASSEEIQTELSRFQGMGPKTISCIMLFALGIPDFPVDTHVLRISQKMNWVSGSTSREDAYEYLNGNGVVPDELKLDLHCLLVAHGKRCKDCAANGRPQFPPKEGEGWVCPMRGIRDGITKGTLGGEFGQIDISSACVQNGMESSLDAIPSSVPSLSVSTQEGNASNGIVCKGQSQGEQSVPYLKSALKRDGADADLEHEMCSIKVEEVVSSAAVKLEAWM